MSRVRTIKRKRLPDWEQRLFAFINSSRNRELEWGDFDCVVGLASGAVLAQTGVDLSEKYAGKYDTEKGAMKILNKKSWRGPDLADTLTNVMDSFLQRAPKGDHHRGNILLLETEDGVGFGIRTGREVLALAREGGTRLFKAPVGALEWTVI